MSDVTPPEPPQFDPPAAPTPPPPPNYAPMPPMTQAPTYYAVPSEPQPPAPYATWIRRVGGSLIDSLILSIPLGIFLVGGIIWGRSTVKPQLCQGMNPDGTYYGCVSQPGSHFTTAAYIPIALGILWFIGWYVYVVVAIGGKNGATVGMKALKMRCVKADTFDQVGIGRSLGRLAITWVFSVACGILSLVDDLFPLWDAKRQTLHDKVVSTVVLFEG